MDIKQMLVEADARLDKILIGGSDVFLMADARRILKNAYDQLSKEPEKEVNSDG